MPNLTAQAQKDLQSAIDLMVNGSARELPISEDVIERIARVAKDEGFPTTGEVYAAVRDNPFSSLIQGVLQAGQGILTPTQTAQVTDAMNLMLVGTAYETPLSEDVVERLAPAAASCGFLATTGAFYEAVKLNPVSTFLRWALFLGKQ